MSQKQKKKQRKADRYKERRDEYLSARYEEIEDFWQPISFVLGQGWSLSTRCFRVWKKQDTYFIQDKFNGRIRKVPESKLKRNMYEFSHGYIRMPFLYQQQGFTLEAPDGIQTEKETC